MCDFAADAEAARQLLVGRVLTVERAYDTQPVPASRRSHGDG
jgi:hypothetical protein